MYHQRQESAGSAIPLHNYSYQQAPGGNGQGYGSAYEEKQYPQGKATRSGGRRKWPWVVGALVLIAVILGAVLGGVFGSRAANDSKKSDAASGAGNGGATGSGVANAATRTKGSGGFAIVPTATDQFGNPMYPTTTGSAHIAAPTVVSNSSLSCQADSTSGLSLTSPKTTHPLLIATENKWNCLPALIAQDSYMSYWNDTIFLNATKFYDMSPTNYSIDGGLTGSGVLDVAREVQLRIKHWAYAYRISNDTKWVDRTWRELVVASGNDTNQYFGQDNKGGDIWNSAHFLDLAEFTEAFALAYDWMYDAWTQQQRTAIAWSIVNLGLRYGVNAFADPNGAGVNYSWWTQVDGNWNCVCNKGLAMGALAIFNEDPTNGIAKQILGYTVPNAVEYCSFAPSPEGTWSETANYWYFGTYSHVEMAASLLTATGSTQNMLDANPGMKLSATYHMYVTGMQGLFNYGDCGPNKYTATANGIMFYGSQFNMPVYTLFQRDRGDAPEPMSMLYYDPQVTGQFWDNLPLDHYFSNTTDGWFSARSSWTDNDGIYIAMKAGTLTGHQTHGDLDTGDFVLDAMGQRWAGELGSGNYLSNGYFVSEAQNSPRWLYYRKRTEGQNTLLIGDADQNVAGVPQTTFQSTGEAQDALDYTPANSSTAFFTADLSEMYNSTTSVKRAIRFINGRHQVLLRDEVDSSAAVQWRMNTNATVALSNNNQQATLTLGGETLVMQLRSPSGAQFGTAQPTRLPSDPTSTYYDGATVTMSPDQPNPGVTVVTIDVAAGNNVIEVLFNPQWKGFKSSDYLTPPSVPIGSWSLTSHD
ncbi:heparinase II/III family protein [Rhodotorula toruloides]|uniref:Heparinase II/III family protein n=1 Tax=Rhodotorula toruloides TaxID=5286 RepID=A0A511KCP8_RHOTO|nr:heparinase II/III family protein [Rhodotorula toruloides]